MSPVTRLGALVLVLSACSAEKPSASSVDAGAVSSAGGATSTGGASSGGSNSASGGHGGSALANGGSPNAGGSAAGGMGGATSGGASALPCASGKSIVMPLGDSITAGANASDQGGYRTRLFHLAHAAGKSVLFVGGMSNGPASVDGVPFSSAHEGHPGYKIDVSGPGDWYGLAPLVDGALSTHHPEIILLMIGTNDVLQDYDLGHAGDRLARLLDQIIADAPDACLVVAQATPLKNGTDDAQIRALNALIPGMVAERAATGKHIGTVDQHAGFTADSSFEVDYLVQDGIHPTDAGYARMASVWFDAIGGLLE